MPTKYPQRIGLTLFFGGAVLAAQTNPTPTVVMPTISFAAPMVQAGVMGGFIGGVGLAPLQPLRGAPYSAQQVTEQVQTLADGSHITQPPRTVLLYRDSEGRTRTEHIFTPPPGAVATSPVPGFVEIYDTVGGFRYTLDQRNRVAHRAPWQPAFQRTVAGAGVRNAAGASKVLTAIAVLQAAPFPAPIYASPQTGDPSSRPHPEMKQESLGTQTIEGVVAEGKRMTITYPEGMMGNDRPLTTVSETWTSPELKMVVLTKTTDPRNGESTTRLTNLSQAEPDAALFQVPADYTVQDEPPPNIVR